MNLLFSILVCTFISIYARLKKSLSLSGIAGAYLVGIPTFINDNHLFTTALLIFFFAGSRVTKIKSDVKRKLEDNHLEGGQRNIVQVFCNGLTGAVLSILHMIYAEKNACFGLNRIHTTLIVAYLAHYSCCAGDTFASEIGILNKSNPILITTFKRVPPGTNGAISSLGIFASLVGGSIIGLVSIPFILVEPCQHLTLYTSSILILLCAFAGFLGSMIHSLLGATLQQSRYNKATKKILGDDTKTLSKEVVLISGYHVLSNNQVNFISSLLTVAVMAALLQIFFR